MLKTFTTLPLISVQKCFQSSQDSIVPSFCNKTLNKTPYSRGLNVAFTPDAQKPYKRSLGEEGLYQKILPHGWSLNPIFRREISHRENPQLLLLSGGGSTLGLFLLQWNGTRCALRKTRGGFIGQCHVPSFHRMKRMLRFWNSSTWEVPWSWPTKGIPFFGKEEKWQTCGSCIRS